MDSYADSDAYGTANSSLGIMDHKPKGSASLASVVSAFVPTWAVGLVFIAIFIVIRHRYPKIYMPRTFIGTIPEKHRTPAPTGAWFDWVHTMRHVPDTFVLHHQSLDSYLFLRFLRTIIFTLVAGCAITWPILMPINATGGGSSTQLDAIGIGNVKDRKKLYAHAAVAWVFFAFVMFTIARERMWLIGLRQAWILSKANASRLSSRTVLYLSAPHDALEESNMNRYFGDAAVRIWPATKMTALESLASSRSSLVDKLESAEMSLIRKADRKVAKDRKHHGSQDGDGNAYESLPEEVRESIRPKSFVSSGKRVDSIELLREKIKEKEAELEEARQSYDVGHPHGAAAVFVEFRTLADAHQASQQVASANVLALTPRHTNVPPGEVIWKNLTLSPASRASRDGIATLIVSAIILFWSIPSGFVGLISNISYLADNFEWLSFLRKLPDPVIGLLSGLVPPLITSALSKFVPSLFRMIFQYFGSPTSTANELKVQKWFYIFQVIQVFLVTAVFSGAATVVAQLLDKLKNPTTVPELLARQLPKSANFYLTYFLIQGSTTAADNMLNYSDLLFYLFYDRFLDKTPRQKFNRFTSMKGIAWGKVYPKFANFAIIAIAYSCIAPLVMGLCVLGLSLYYFSYRHNLLFVIQSKMDTKGEAYTLALQHLLTGVYIAELALIGIFGLRQATGPSVLVGVLFILTALCNSLMNKYLEPLEKFLPTELASSLDDGSETTPLLSSAEEGQAQSHIQHLGEQAHVSPEVAKRVVNPMARFFEPHIFTTRRSMQAWLENDKYSSMTDGGQEPSYSEDNLRTAYMNPAMTSSTPIVWLAQDCAGASKSEIRENEKAELKATDQGAWLDDSGRVKWSVDDIGQVPIWKEKTPY